MQKIYYFFLILCLVCLSCEKDSNKEKQKETKHIARIESYNLNCSTCILEFPIDSTEIKKIIGDSPNNLYEAINLNKNDFQIGHLVTVKIRKPEQNESNACLTLYPSNNFKGIYITESGNSEELELNDTIEINNKTCKYNSENQFFLCLDSILEDSRCPTGAECFLAGDARIRFHFEKLNGQPVDFILHTDEFATHEITIEGYKITLLDLLPYPTVHNIQYKGSRRAKMIIKEIP
jgi:hypothetical protein